MGPGLCFTKFTPLLERAAGGGQDLRTQRKVLDPQPESHQLLRPMSLTTLETFLALNLSGVASPPRLLRHLHWLFPP